MLADILLDPNNRLLHGAAADFSMFGAQPIVTLGAEQARDEGGGFVTTALGATDRTATDRDLTVSAKASYTPDVDAGSGPVARANTTEAFGQPASSAAPSVTHYDSDAVASANGSGSAIPMIVVPSPIETTPGAAQDIAPASSGLTAPILDLPIAAPLPLEGFALGALSTSLVGPVLDETGAVADLVQGTIQAALPAIDTAVEGVAATLDTVVAPIAQSLAGNVEALVADLGAGPIDAVQQTVGAVGDTVEATVGAVGGTVESTAGVVGGAVGDTLAAVAPDPIDIFAGSDPAAGVATLAGMVASADVFDLTDTVATDTVDSAGSILDGLVLDGEAVSPLLGDLDHHTGGIIDDLDHGLLGGL